MSQESGTSSTLLNLETQLADAMTVIQTLMANVGNLTQQVIHLTQNVADKLREREDGGGKRQFILTLDITTV